MSASAQWWLAVFGGIVLTLIGAATGGLAALFAGIWLWTYRPRVHFGAPRADLRLKTYATKVLIGPDGPGHPAILQNLRLCWWAGLSSRNSASWFLGIMRWVPDSRPTHPECWP
jgi:hypothetical protein